MGKLNIPDNYRIIREGITKRKDRVFHTEKFCFPVAVGGIDVRNYYAVIRRNPSIKTASPAPRKAKKAVKKKIAKKIVKRKKK